MICLNCFQTNRLKCATATVIVCPLPMEARRQGCVPVRIMELYECNHIHSAVFAVMSNTSSFVSTTWHSWTWNGEVSRLRPACGHPYRERPAFLTTLRFVILTCSRESMVGRPTFFWYYRLYRPNAFWAEHSSVPAVEPFNVKLIRILDYCAR